MQTQQNESGKPEQSANHKAAKLRLKECGVAVAIALLVTVVALAANLFGLMQRGYAGYLLSLIWIGALAYVVMHIPSKCEWD